MVLTSLSCPPRRATHPVGVKTSCVGHRVRNIAQKGLARQGPGDALLHLLSGANDLLDGQLATRQPVLCLSQSQHEIPCAMGCQAKIDTVGRLG